MTTAEQLSADAKDQQIAQLREALAAMMSVPPGNSQAAFNAKLRADRLAHQAYCDTAPAEVKQAALGFARDMAPHLRLRDYADAIVQCGSHILTEAEKCFANLRPAA